MLKQKYVTLISEKPLLFGKVAAVAKKRPTTILHWIRTKQYKNFCTVDILKTIAEYTGVSDIRKLVETTTT